MAKNLYFRYGAMNCGKSTRVLQEAHNYEQYDHKVVVTKPGIDTKGKDHIVSRLGVQREADFVITPEDRVLEKLAPVVARHEIKCVFIDEAQFLTVPQVEELAWGVVPQDGLNIAVIAYGLRLDFQANGFPASEKLMLEADKVEEMPAICPCGDHKARFNARMVDGEYTFEGDQVAIDGEGVSYVSLCRDCFRREASKSEAGRTALMNAGNLVLV
ncbi:MAG TPA: thymidine kinase [Candidatus Saccharimonadales bacterium]|nr:thymidine kinase [Candidatus Saccharimonadales bacterium]